jgi:hypothetical protein
MITKDFPVCEICGQHKYQDGTCSVCCEEISSLRTENKQLRAERDALVKIRETAEAVSRHDDYPSHQRSVYFCPCYRCYHSNVRRQAALDILAGLGPTK